MKKPRQREIPPYESGDIILREDFLIGDKLLSEVEIDKTLIVIDNPSKGYLEEVEQEVAEMFSERNNGRITCTYKEYAKKTEVKEGKEYFIFLNIRKAADKRSIIEKEKQKYYFVSNVYKIENTEQLRQTEIKRVLPVKEGFGLVRSPVAFARTHEIVFVGAPHLKRNGFIIALERNITVPCIVTVATEKEIEEVEECIERVKALGSKYTTALEEYTEKKKWIYIVTDKNLKKEVAEGSLKKLKEITKSVIAYTATDSTSQLLTMHQVSQSVFSLTTTQDNGKTKKIVKILPKYGVILEEVAQEMKKIYETEEAQLIKAEE